MPYPLPGSGQKLTERHPGGEKLKILCVQHRLRSVYNPTEKSMIDMTSNKFWVFGLFLSFLVFNVIHSAVCLVQIISIKFSQFKTTSFGDCLCQVLIQ